MDLVDSFLRSVAAILPKPVSQLTIAYSGGVDSHVLLHLFHRFQHLLQIDELQAVYVNHGLSPNADDWQQHCKQTCESMAITIQALSVKVERESGLGLEASARSARYQALLSVTREQGVIALGQHQDDQIETLMLQLKRGAGPAGLSGMPPLREEQGRWLIRPLLNCSRESIERYALQHKLNYIEDESNLDTQFDRNFLRHDILPKLNQRWPGFRNAAARSARLCYEQQQLLDEVCTEKLAAMVDEQGRLAVEQVSTQSPVWQRQLLRQWLMQCKAPIPSEAQLHQIQQMLEAKQDAQPLVELADFQVRRFNQQLYCQQHLPVSSKTVLTADQQGRVVLPNQRGWLEFERRECDYSCQTDNQIFASIESIVVRFDLPLSSRFKPLGKPQTKPLKQWYKAWQVPPWQRTDIAQICVDDQLIAIVYQGNVIVNQSATKPKTGQQRLNIRYVAT